MIKRFAIRLCLLVCWMSACTVTPALTSTPSPTVSIPPTVSPSPTPTVIENMGLICFTGFDKSSKELRGMFRPKGCFSSSCTRPLEQKVDVALDSNQSAIRFLTRFALLDTTVRAPQAQACTADCEGGGRVEFTIGDVTEGQYTIWLGEQRLGTLEVTPTLSITNDVCFGDTV